MDGTKNGLTVVCEGSKKGNDSPCASRVQTGGGLVEKEE